MKPAVEADSLCKTYRAAKLEVEVLKKIKLTIEEGEFVSIMGPSGSGKSTFLYLAGGLDKPTSGTIRIKGRDITSLTDREISAMRRKELGFVFQFYNLVPNLNVEENVLLPVFLDGKRYGLYKDKLNEILETVGLTGRKKHTPRELSGGEQQRVAIARALINEPDILLADEPTGNLDSNTGKQIMELLARINRENRKAVIMVTHSTEAAEYSHRIVNIRDGQVYEG
jgi:putative ABC transport system ATP-binding protein